MISKPKYKPIPNNKKTVVFLGITIFFIEYVGILLIINNGMIIKIIHLKVGT